MRNASAPMNAEMNVTPFLDVLLVLLILFMYLCLNQQKVMTAQLPEPGTRPPMDVAVPIVLEVRPSSAYAINTKLVAAEELETRLRSLYEKRGDKTILIRATPGVRYQDVVAAMDVAKGAGVVAIGLGGGRGDSR